MSPVDISRCRQRGMALAIVVWFIAGMSVLVAGIVSHVRVDTRMTQLHVAKAKAAAAGDGAIHLIMSDLFAGRLSQQNGVISSGVYKLGSLVVEVKLVPAAGLVDINSAPAELLSGLFKVAGGLEVTQANTVADNMVKWRSGVSTGNARNRPRRFVALEDLLRIEGVNRRLLDSVRDYVVAGEPRQRGSNWSVAPEAVLDVLRESNPQQAESALRQRQRLMEARNTSGSPAGSPVGSGIVRADAIVRYGDQSWLRRRWVIRSPGAGSSLPWSTQRTEAVRVVELQK